MGKMSSLQNITKSLWQLRMLGRQGPPAGLWPFGQALPSKGSV
jgi:hypothetical protein